MIRIKQQTEKSFHVGDTVQLNSGSPDLQVIALDGDAVTVEWKDKTTLPTACFEPASRSL